MLRSIKKVSNSFIVNCVHGYLVNQKQLKAKLWLQKRKDGSKSWSRIDILAQVAQVENMESTGMEMRQYYLSVLQRHGPGKFMEILDQVDPNEAEELESYIISEIQSIRKDRKKYELKVSEHLRQIAIAHSQYLCGNCVRTFNNMPYPTMAFVIIRKDNDSHKNYAENVRHYWEIKDIIPKLEDECLTHIGLGVWGTSQTFVVTLVTTQTKSSLGEKP